jgi:hypothetical protein
MQFYKYQTSSRPGTLSSVVDRQPNALVISLFSKIKHFLKFSLNLVNDE